MKITIKNIDWTPTLEALALKALRQGAATNPTPDGVEYPIDDAKISQVELNALLLEPCTIDDVVVYVKVLSSVLDNLVDVDLPDSKYIDENGDEQRRNYLDYFHQTPTLNNAGDEALVMVGHRAYGAPNPVALPPDAEIRAWLGVFGSLLTVQESNTLRATPEWQPEEQI